MKTSQANIFFVARVPGGSRLSRRASPSLSPKTNAQSSTVFVDEFYPSRFDRQLQFFSRLV
jgi:hypothetical protein